MFIVYIIYSQQLNDGSIQITVCICMFINLYHSLFFMMINAMIILLSLSTTILYISNSLHDGIYIYLYIYRLIHSVNKNLAEHSEKLDDATKTEVQAAIDAANSVSSDADLEKLREAVSSLSNASMKIGQAMYNKKGGDVDGDDSSSSKSDKESGSEKKGKEAEYEEKK